MAPVVGLKKEASSRRNVLVNEQRQQQQRKMLSQKTARRETNTPQYDKPRPFPCTDVDRPLTSRPFCGLLVPPDVFETSIMNPRLFGERQKKSKDPTKWKCWLCETSNKSGNFDCCACGRPRTPDWLQLASGDVIAIGNLVKLWKNKQLFIGLVTRIDYLKKSLTLHTVKLRTLSEGEVETDFHAAQPVAGSSPQVMIVPYNEIEAGKVTLIWGQDRCEDETIPLTLVMCDYLLCGECGHVSKLNNGRSALDSEAVQNDKRGRLRMLTEEIEHDANQVRYFTRRWRDTKTGYDELTAATELLNKKKSVAEALRTELAPLQLWCTFCGWKWPETRPFTI